MIRQCLGLVCALATGTVAAAQPAPIEGFVREPHMHHAELSPDGRRVAFTSENQDGQVLIVFGLDDRSIQAADISDMRAHGLRWADNRVVLLTASEATSVFGVSGALDFSAVVAFDTEDDMDARQLLRNRRQVGRTLNAGTIAGIDWETGRVLMPVHDEDFDYNLLSVDPLSGNTRIEARGDRSTIGWILDSESEVFARMEFDIQRQYQAVLLPDGHSWRAVAELHGNNRPLYSLNGLLPDGRVAADTTRQAGDDDYRSGLFEVSLDSGEIVDTLFLHEEYDLSQIVVDPYTNAILGVSWYEDFLQTRWFDEDFAQMQADLDASLPGQNPLIQSWDEERSRILVATESVSEPPAYLIYDRGASAIYTIGQSRPELSGGVLQPRAKITYTTRDDVKVEAYLTLPEGDGPYPTVILPHGGPEARDIAGFDSFAHFIASRGYAVIQPNFRGSAGYGYAWVEAGHGGWGTGVMQHDLTDAVEHLVSNGIADPERVCIVGASYGGYAALAGATYTPDLYSCAIAIAGVSDLPAMIDYTRDRYGRNHWFVESWAERFAGDDLGELDATMRAVSPSHHAENVRIPVLMIHGLDDSVVPVDQSRIMQRELEQAGADSELIELDNGDHWLMQTEVREAVFTQMERFLAEHIGEQQ